MKKAPVVAFFGLVLCFVLTGNPHMQNRHGQNIISSHFSTQLLVVCELQQAASDVNLCNSSVSYNKFSYKEVSFCLVALMQHTGTRASHSYRHQTKY